MPVWVTLRRARADFLGLNDKCDPEKLLTEAFAFLLSTMQYLHIHGNLAPLQQQRSPPYVLDGLHIIGFVSSYLPGARRANTIRCFLLFVGFATGRCGPFGDKWRGCSCIHHFTARDNGGKSSSVLVSSANREPLIGEALAHHVLDVVIEGRTCLW
ncbi:hypothetical protein FOIG_00689 [Fusarium odoratissimum NRRL 54006]|uniref:Uncharacterized protein n=2 Tax=Fusarium oxysporum species complex TaxID=171631 RepID=X0KPP0_FUSO5|nr:uncharacterized protein FOIG_00689 [Fusarium odoratissimum NRRL 54006]XP_031072806.1 uncharacterized protein FOIG_00689 [Fusarium odoratissimum NRRL 54006]XP_031072807.1 uncharacterized protein FOIG_00689 [Fusarium odoratissimum NRRL 54006]TXC04617.1 hypothetical protein FocTR4_00001463 [Fusarium oxysporum f. sp. cubense]EXM10716.1 hypothetical protein FOIG_00689 [Fusarium odoratissimum NRRL 54006]EXM10717.1 hypothetical protein FOIG_00689 [Fusarium odoratissimum NRRL 54006]EXM10718.1 hypo